MYSYRYGNNINGVLKFIPPQKENLIQWGDGKWYDAGDGANILRCDDLTERGNYLLLNTSTGEINQNPNTLTADGIILTARGFTGYQTRAALALLNDGELSFTSTATTPVPPVYKTLEYADGTSLSDKQAIKNNGYVEGESVVVPENAILDDFGDPIFDDVGDYILE